MSTKIEPVIKAIDYIEHHLLEKLDLELVSCAVHYSKYHLHRMFTNTVGMTMQTYIKRRQLTEAAKLLVFSKQSILEIALLSGYQSQQSFSTIFKAMYKKSPHQYREEEVFYPLQLRYVLNENPTTVTENTCWYSKISYATTDDIPAWMELVRLVVDGFPHLYESEYLERLQTNIYQRQALILKDQTLAIGIMILKKATGSIDFLGIHPQYRTMGIAQAFLKRAFEELIGNNTSLSITTFREGDKADTGYRMDIKNLGFAEAELLMEFDYPTQRFVLKKEDWEEETYDKTKDKCSSTISEL